jgi:hypothetical protein
MAVKPVKNPFKKFIVLILDNHGFSVPNMQKPWKK